MKKDNYFRSERWNAGIGNGLDAALGKQFDSAAEQQDGQASGVLQAVLTPVADLALTYYDRRIRAYFRRANIDIGDDVLTVDSIQKKIKSSTELEIEEFTANGLMLALEKPLARALSELLGFVVTAVFDQVELKRQVKEHVIQRLIDGEGGGVLKGRALHRLREAATYAQSGMGAGEKRRLLNRAYQRAYRRGNSQTWV